jgi:hypothetical protein
MPKWPAGYSCAGLKPQNPKFICRRRIAQLSTAFRLRVCSVLLRAVVVWVHPVVVGVGRRDVLCLSLFFLFVTVFSSEVSFVVCHSRDE